MAEIDIIGPDSRPDRYTVDHENEILADLVPLPPAAAPVVRRGA